MHTLLSQLPAARKSACGENASEDIESGGGSETSISFSRAVEALLTLVPKNDMRG